MPSHMCGLEEGSKNNSEVNLLFILNLSLFTFYCFFSRVCMRVHICCRERVRVHCLPCPVIPTEVNKTNYIANVYLQTFGIIFYNFVYTAYYLILCNNVYGEIAQEDDLIEDNCSMSPPNTEQCYNDGTSVIRDRSGHYAVPIFGQRVWVRRRQRTVSTPSLFHTIHSKCVILTGMAGMNKLGARHLILFNFDSTN